MTARPIVPAPPHQRQRRQYGRTNSGQPRPRLPLPATPPSPGSTAPRSRVHRDRRPAPPPSARCDPADHHTAFPAHRAPHGQYRPKRCRLASLPPEHEPSGRGQQVRCALAARDRLTSQVRPTAVTAATSRFTLTAGCHRTRPSRMLYAPAGTATTPNPPPSPCPRRAGRYPHPSRRPQPPPGSP